MENHTTDAPCGRFCVAWYVAWALHFLLCNHTQVTKKQVDNFKKGKLTPCCQLLAKVSGRRKQVPSVSHQVSLKGAKFPHDVFLINLPQSVGGI